MQPSIDKNGAVLALPPGPLDLEAAAAVRAEEQCLPTVRSTSNLYSRVDLQRLIQLNQGDCSMNNDLASGMLIALIVVGCGSDLSTAEVTSGGASADAGSAATALGGSGDAVAGASGIVAEAGGTASVAQGGSVSVSGATGVAAGGTIAAGGATAVATAGSAPCSVTYYRDADADSWGSAETSCTGGTGWVNRTGDCNDLNAEVFPNQTKDFDKSYTSSAGLQSFDFNCDGLESIANGTQVSTGACTSSGLGNACAGDGYLPVEPARDGSNLNQTCGSTRYLVCSRSQQVCVGATSADGTYQAARCN
jgi:hypothetical protein